MASKIRNIEAIYDNFGEKANIILNKITTDGIKISDKSTSFVLNIGSNILNYIDFIHNGDVSTIEHKSINEIQQEYLEWFNVTKTNFKYNNYIELSDVLFDYRVNGIGHYWVDLKTSQNFT